MYIKIYFCCIEMCNLVNVYLDRLARVVCVQINKVSHFQNRKSNNCRLYVKCNVWKFTRTVYGTALQIYRNRSKVISFFLVLKKQRNTLCLGRILIRLNNYGSRWKAD